MCEWTCVCLSSLSFRLLLYTYVHTSAPRNKTRPKGKWARELTLMSWQTHTKQKNYAPFLVSFLHTTLLAKISIGATCLSKDGLHRSVSFPSRSMISWLVTVMLSNYWCSLFVQSQCNLFARMEFSCCAPSRCRLYLQPVRTRIKAEISRHAFSSF